jgi:hypothetical protein
MYIFYTIVTCITSSHIYFTHSSFSFKKFNLKFEAKQIYLKQAKICDFHTLPKKLNAKICKFVITIWGGLSVLMPIISRISNLDYMHVLNIHLLIHAKIIFY